MNTKPEDISPKMREFYKWLRGRPGMFIGSNDIHDLNVFMQGMKSCASAFFDEKEKPVLIPEGFTKYVEDYYGEHMSFNSFSFVEHLDNETNNGIAKWFELLDSYLISLGYEPIPEIVTNSDRVNAYMIIDLIKKQYNGNIMFQKPADCNDPDLPECLKELLLLSDGIKETMTHPNTGENMEIGWIIYSYKEICTATKYYKEEYGIPGIVFSGDGGGNPYYIYDGKVYEFDPIDNESVIKADSFEDFFKPES